MKWLLYCLCFFAPHLWAGEDPVCWQGTTFAKENLPYVVRQKLKIIALGAPYPVREDNTIFHNLPPRLPVAPRGFYRLFIVQTEQGNAHEHYRIIQAGNHFYFSPDRLQTFYPIC